MRVGAKSYTRYHNCSVSNYSQSERFDDGASLNVKDVVVDKGSHNGIKKDGLCNEKFEVGP